MNDNDEKLPNTHLNSFLTTPPTSGTQLKRPLCNMGRRSEPRDIRCFLTAFFESKSLIQFKSADQLVHCRKIQDISPNNLCLTSMFANP
ncbi:unnamed protein product [Tetraodon nigroviridis]|uniref:(spotted green pufferfish) hypothetical protein n=1 Tax=Tetraodon nigroviridis TaxID=99883 RepID=Q4SPA8_TETNG|nr:unnamed protein product [Tetraodon nigroviridis]